MAVSKWSGNTFVWWEMNTQHPVSLKGVHYTGGAGRERQRQDCECVLMGIIWRWKTNGTAVGLQPTPLNVCSRWECLFLLNLWIVYQSLGELQMVDSGTEFNLISHCLIGQRKNRISHEKHVKPSLSNLLGEKPYLLRQLIDGESNWFLVETIRRQQVKFIIVLTFKMFDQCSVGTQGEEAQFYMRGRNSSANTACKQRQRVVSEWDLAWITECTSTWCLVDKMRNSAQPIKLDVTLIWLVSHAAYAPDKRFSQNPISINC